MLTVQSFSTLVREKQTHLAELEARLSHDHEAHQQEIDQLKA
jgi:hypothetical protein